MRRVARPLAWRVVVLKREEQAASLIRLILSPSSGDLAQLPETLVAAQSTSRRTLTVDEDGNGDAPGLLMPTTVSRLVAKLSGLRRVYLTDFKAIQNDDTSFDGKISIDFSSSGPLRKLHRLVINDGALYLKRVLAVAPHALVELALPASFKGAAEDVEQVLSSRVLPHLRRLRLGVPQSKAGKPRRVLTAPSADFLAQLDYLELVDPVLSTSSSWWDDWERTSLPLDHPYFTTSTPVLFDLGSATSLSRCSSPALDLVRHVFVRSVSDWVRLAEVVSHAAFETLYVPEDLHVGSASAWDAFNEACDDADVELLVVEKDKYAVILPKFVEYCSAGREEEDAA